jgi:anti-sigma-K factor RskA
MAETERDNERDDLAAEYVLGTLDAAERAEVERRLRIDVQLARAVAAWERRFEPLLDTMEPVEPPPDALAVINARIDANPESTAPQDSPMAEIVHLRRRVRNWRIATIAASAIAATLALFIGVYDAPEVTDERFVAVLEGDSRNPAFVAAVNVKDRSIMVLRVGGELAAAPGHSHELWALGGGRAAPQSLGLLDASASIPADKLGQLDPSTLETTSFAVSLEPEGGSLTGQPTGPVMFSGKLVPIPRR